MEWRPMIHRETIRSIDIDQIHVGERFRESISDDRIVALADSISDIGLQMPISVRFIDSMVIDGEENLNVPVLITGRTRLLAAQKLGWQYIDCFIVKSDDLDAQLWEIAENLHRVDLTKDERDRHIRRYAELLEQKETTKIHVGHFGTPEIDYKKPPSQTKGTARKIADATGLSKK